MTMEVEAPEMDVDDTGTENVDAELSQGLEDFFQAEESFFKCEINVSTTRSVVRI